MKEPVVGQTKADNKVAVPGTGWSSNFLYPDLKRVIGY
jgi:hypothetical protein